MGRDFFLAACEVASRRLHYALWGDAPWTICARAADMATVCPRWALARTALDLLTARWHEPGHCEASRLRACLDAAPAEWRAD